MGSIVVPATVTRTHFITVPMSRVDPTFQAKRRATALGFVLVKLRENNDKRVWQGLLDVPGVREVFPLFGEFDLLVEIEADSYDALGERVFNGVRRIPGVKATRTLTATSL